MNIFVHLIIHNFLIYFLGVNFSERAGTLLWLLVHQDVLKNTDRVCGFLKHKLSHSIYSRKSPFYLIKFVPFDNVWKSLPRTNPSVIISSVPEFT